MNPSPYDIAWMARVPSENGASARWPDLLDWLIEHQWLNGSWGGSIHYWHDRIICTLAAIIALKEQASGEIIEQAIKRGVKFLWQNMHALSYDPVALVNFELILPTLLDEASRLGLDVPKHICGYNQVRMEKLNHISTSHIHSSNVTTAYSLEFLGRTGNLDSIRQMKLANGSVGNSPATTSYYLLLEEKKDESTLNYLQSIVNSNQHIVCLSPCHTFELVTVLSSFSHCREPLENLVDASVWEYLYINFGERGIGIDPSFGIQDCRTTSLTMRLLTLAGYSVQPEVLTQFEDKKKRIFHTYYPEQNGSISTNIHALEALHVLHEYPDRQKVKESILTFLMSHRTFDTYWQDKWHSSPIYATSTALIGISYAAPKYIQECQRTIEWLTHTQREDGSWGFFARGTAEETAYVLMALLHCREHFPIDNDLLRQGASYLCRETSDGIDDVYPPPPLWIGKTLFAPYDVIRASTLATLILFEKVVGSL
jgi:halimadienyl-diphosphate synthase